DAREGEVGQGLARSGLAVVRPQALGEGDLAHEAVSIRRRFDEAVPDLDRESARALERVAAGELAHNAADGAAPGEGEAGRDDRDDAGAGGRAVHGSPLAGRGAALAGCSILLQRAWRERDADPVRRTGCAVLMLRALHVPHRA